MRAIEPVLLVMMLIGCRRDPAPSSTSRAAAPDATPPIEVATFADASAAPPSDGGFPPDVAPLFPRAAKPVLGPFAWPPNGASAFASAGSMYFGWRVGEKTGSSFVTADRVPARAIVKDVDGKPGPELVVFLAPREKPIDPHEDHATFWIYGLRAEGDAARMIALESALIGVRDEATLEEELGQRGKLGRTRDVAPERIVARLGWATPEEIKALASPRGLKLCERFATKRSCATHAADAIDPALVETAKKKMGSFATFATDEQKDLLAPYCFDDEKPGRLKCTATAGGPTGVDWVFDKTPEGLRLAEVWSWAEET